MATQIKVTETGQIGPGLELQQENGRQPRHRIIQAVLSVTLHAMAVTYSKQCTAADWQNGSP